MRSLQWHCALGALLASVGLLACNSYDSSLLGKPSPAVDRSACAEHVELCNNHDDDCDGIIDEDASSSCSLDHARTHCSAGSCVLDACDEGYLSCDGASDNGCERDVAACGDCSHACAEEDAMKPPQAGSAAPETGQIEAGKASIPDEADAGEPDTDAGPKNRCSEERCDGIDNDCDGRTDEGLVCGCTASAPTSQGEECDRCVCERCGSALDHCLASGNADWDTSCGALMRCVGKNTLDGKCSDDADCSSACGAQWYGSGWRPNHACTVDDVSTACAAFVVIQKTCYQTKCDKACKH